MLDLGFAEDVEKLIAATSPLRQTMLFSATMPADIVKLARRHLRHPVNIRAESTEEGQTVPATAQFVYQAHDLDKPELVARILQAENHGRTIVFCPTKRQCQRLSDDLRERGFDAASIHGDLTQVAREKNLERFRGDKIDVLVATDVAARGIDVEAVTHVINYACPEDEKAYLHRIGRTGRAGASGIAVTLVDWADLPRWRSINKMLGLPFEDPPETYSTSEHLFHDMGIPAGTKGRKAGAVSLAPEGGQQLASARDAVRCVTEPAAVAVAAARVAVAATAARVAVVPAVTATPDRRRPTPGARCRIPPTATRRPAHRRRPARRPRGPIGRRATVSVAAVRATNSSSRPADGTQVGPVGAQRVRSTGGDEGGHRVRDQLHCDRRQQQAGDAGDQRDPAFAQDAHQDARVAHHEPQHEVDRDDSDGDGDERGRGVNPSARTPSSPRSLPARPAAVSPTARVRRSCWPSGTDRPPGPSAARAPPATAAARRHPGARRARCRGSR